ncbi:MAG: TIGR04013 family B12-binding domain/radical SAM domain-containing protein [Spirochaetes bacterium]|nr:TIGR04013 family B12-binding domain/radical SAM domain-containing protein [Spirochaetota bacterium]
MKKLVIVAFLENNNKYSFNALIPSIEQLEKSFDFDIKIFYDFNLIKKFILENKNEYENFFFLFSILTSELLKYKFLISEIKCLEKEIDKNFFIINGGPHIIGKPDSIKFLNSDIGFIDESEITIKELIECFFKKKFNKKNKEEFIGHLKDKKFNNLSLYYDNKVFINKRIKNIDDLNNVRYFSDKYQLYGPIEITRGCFFNCAYCQTPQITAKLVRHRNIENIVEMVKLSIKNNIRDLRFISPDASSYMSLKKNEVNLEKIENLLLSIRKISGNKIKIYFGSFPSEIRPDNISDDLLKIIKKYANNKRIIIGAQSGSDFVLSKIKREHNKEIIFKATSIILRNGFEPHVDFIFGLPFENKEFQIESLRFIEKLVNMGAKIHSHFFMPLPGTILAKSKPLNLENEIVCKIYKLEGTQKMYGEWKKQLQIAEKIFSTF